MNMYIYIYITIIIAGRHWFAHCRPWHAMQWHGTTYPWINDMPWYDMPWHDNGYGIPCHCIGMAWHGTPWHPIASHGIPWHPMARHGMQWHTTGVDPRVRARAEDRPWVVDADVASNKRYS